MQPIVSHVKRNGRLNTIISMCSWKVVVSFNVRHINIHTVVMINIMINTCSGIQLSSSKLRCSLLGKQSSGSMPAHRETCKHDPTFYLACEVMMSTCEVWRMKIFNPSNLINYNPSISIIPLYLCTVFRYFNATRSIMFCCSSYVDIPFKIESCKFISAVLIICPVLSTTKTLLVYFYIVISNSYYLTEIDCWIRCV